MDEMTSLSLTSELPPQPLSAVSAKRLASHFNFYLRYDQQINDATRDLKHVFHSLAGEKETGSDTDRFDKEGM
ncbi:hypothetical protein BPOR_1471g00010 [Botrytis porri]|uniref:Uncharacterized protein n=1 Tax=Botrytis porri TaxID=87229 RepID=A0A4Z1K4D5_9HELO|nr:hypothetical protein BPOR_1471g00010 [Botrytis porri]